MATTKPNSSSSSHLRLHVPQTPAAGQDRAADRFAGVQALCTAFTKATGWDLRLAKGHEAEGNELWSAQIPQPDGPPTRLVVDRPQKIKGNEGSQLEDLLAFENVRPLALELGSLLAELASTRNALWKREAELAAGVPVAVKPDEKHLASRLESVLKGGVEAVGADAAGLYLLDDATTQLKLRAMHNLPRGRFLDQPRQLAGSVADLEALLGHAVVMEDTALLRHWKCPEDFPSAVCLPVSSPTTPLGTLWVFSKSPRDFSSEQTHLLEIIAGRVAADLEREMLVASGAQLRLEERGVRSSALWRKDRMPQFAPLSDEWDLAGWASESPLANEFFDWQVLSDGQIAVSLGAVSGDMHGAPLNMASVQSAWRSHLAHVVEPGMVLAQMNESVRTASAGDLLAVFGQTNLDSRGRAAFASAGNLAAFLWNEDGRKTIAGSLAALGEGEGLSQASTQLTLDRGDLLVLFSPGACNLVDEGGLHIGPEALLKSLSRHRHRPAAQLMTVLRELLLPRLKGENDAATIVMIKRR